MTAAKSQSVEVRWEVTGEVLTVMDAFFEVMTIGDLRQSLSSLVRAPMDYVTLTYKDIVLCDDGSSLVMAGIDDFGVIFISKRLPEPGSLLKLVKSNFGIKRNPFDDVPLDDCERESKGDLAFVQYWIESGCDVNEKDGAWSPFWHGFMTTYWRQYGTSQVGPDETYDGCAALHYAACVGLTGIVKLLLDCVTTDVNARCRAPLDLDDVEWLTVHHDCTAFLCVVGAHQTEVCAVMLEHPRFTLDAICAQTARGFTALHILGADPDRKVADVLLPLAITGKLDLCKLDNSGKSALDLAFETSYSRIAAVLPSAQGHKAVAWAHRTLDSSGYYSQSHASSAQASEDWKCLRDRRILMERAKKAKAERTLRQLEEREQFLAKSTRRKDVNEIFRRRTDKCMSKAAAGKDVLRYALRLEM